MIRVWLFVVVLLGVLGVGAWASDFLTLQGERTVFTVDCVNGRWDGDRCTGKLAAAPRYRYRALKPHHEVIFWTVGSSEPSGKFSDCVIHDGRNWRCKPNAEAARSITLEMSQGTPVVDEPASTRPFRAVAKWRWFLLREGVSLGNTASNPRRTAAARPAGAGASAAAGR